MLVLQDSFLLMSSIKTELERANRLFLKEGNIFW
jgi:hypothetical protein